MKNELVIFVLAFLAIVSLAIARPLSADAAQAFVMLKDQKVFEMAAGVGSLDSEERADVISRRLARIVNTSKSIANPVVVENEDNNVSIKLNGSLVATVTTQDAAASNSSVDELAKQWSNQLQRAVAIYRAQSSIHSISPAAISKWALELISHQLFAKVLIASVGCAILWALSFIARWYARKKIDEHSSLYNTKKMIGIVSMILSVVFITIVFRDTLGNLALIIGAVSAGIAFALKTVITSLAGWVALTFGKYYHVGDRVEMAGIKGDVIDVGFVRTTLMELGKWVDGDLYTGRIVRVSNAFIFEQPVYNYTAYFPFVWDEIKIPVKFDSDLALVRQTLERTLEELTQDDVVTARRYWSVFDRSFMIEAARLEPLVTLSANDNWIEFVARYVVDFKKRRITRDKLFSRILEVFEDSNGHMEFASATFEVVGLPNLRVGRVRSKTAESESADLENNPEAEERAQKDHR